jgi:hypothetical protein
LAGWPLDSLCLIERVPKEVADARRYDEASPVEKIDIDIGRLQQRTTALKRLGAGEEALAELAEEMAELQRRKPRRTARPLTAKPVPGRPADAIRHSGKQQGCAIGLALPPGPPLHAGAGLYTAQDAVLIAARSSEMRAVRLRATWVGAENTTARGSKHLAQLCGQASAWLLSPGPSFRTASSTDMNTWSFPMHSIRPERPASR